MMELSKMFDGELLVAMVLLVPRGASAAAAYHKLFRGAAHMVPSYPAPPAKCKAGSEDRPSPFLSSDRPRTGKYDCRGSAEGDIGPPVPLI